MNVDTTSSQETLTENAGDKLALARKCIRGLLTRLPPLLAQFPPELLGLFKEHPGALTHALRVGILHTGRQLTKVAKVLAFIRRHHAGAIYFPKIAETVRADGNSLRLLLVTVSGKTFQDIVVEARMERAKWLLSHTSQDTALVAKRTGFDSYDSMNRAFKRLTGLTPARYRRRYAKVRFRRNRRN